MTDLLHQEITFAVIGAAMEVHRELGPGFLEPVYQRALEVELSARGVSFESQQRVAVMYKGRVLCEHVLDLVVAGRVVAELKSVRELNDIHRAQLISYLKASRIPVGLLINFAQDSLDYKRLVFTGSTRLQSA